jgi:hypothetical protein
MATVFHRDEQITTDKYLAAFAHYLGYTLHRIEVQPDGTSTFTLRVPQLDWEQVIEESTNAETTICYKSFVESVGFVIRKWSAAKKMGGCWQKV